LRILKNVASPIIYGTDIIRLKTRTTTDLDTMKSVANGAGAGGVLSAFANKIKSFVSSKLGLPSSLIPSNLKLESDTFKGITPFGYSEYFNKLKDSAAGSILGKFLNQAAKGTPNQMGNQLIGGATQMVKDKIKKGLFGESTIGLATGGKVTGTNDDGKMVVFRKDKQGNKLYVKNSTELFNFTRYKYSSNAPYSSKFYVETETDYLKHYLEQVGVGEAQKDFTPLSATILPKKPTAIKYINDYSATPYSTPKNGIIGTQNEYGDYVAENSLNNKRGFTYNELEKDANGNYSVSLPGNYGDALNNLVAFNEADELKENDFTKNLDFIPLKFYSVAKKSVVVFRATISGFSETLRPTWETGKFVGNPFNYYTYSGIERTATFKFKVYSLSASEHIAAWQRIKFLTSLVYPQGYYSAAKYVVPPFIKFTLGDLYNKKEGFIDSLTYTVDDNYSWETGFNAIPGDSANGAIGQKDLTNYKLPMIIDVDISIKFVESEASHGGTVMVKDAKGNETKQYKSDINLYAFGKKADDAKKNIDGGGNPKTNTATSQPKAKDGAKKENPVKQTNTKVDTKTATGKKEYILDGKKVSQSTLESAAGIKH
jgi:hypothetical protein